MPEVSFTGLAGSDLGQLVIASATLADVTGIVLLSLLFSRAEGGAGATIALPVASGLLTVLAGATLARAGRVSRVSMEFMRLADTTAQLRVRAAVVLLVGSWRSPRGSAWRPSSAPSSPTS